MLQLYCTAFLISQTFTLNKFLKTEHALINHSNRMLLRNFAKEFKVGPVLFSDILFVCHTIGNTKLKRKKLEWGNAKCPASLQRVTQQEICTLYTGLESNQNSSTFTKLLRGNDCNPVTDDSEVGSSSCTIRVKKEVESQCHSLDPAEAAKNKDFCCELKDGLKNSIVIVTQFKDRWPWHPGNGVT